MGYTEEFYRKVEDLRRRVELLADLLYANTSMIEDYHVEISKTHEDETTYITYQIYLGLISEDFYDISYYLDTAREIASDLGLKISRVFVDTGERDKNKVYLVLDVEDSTERIEFRYVDES